MILSHFIFILFYSKINLQYSHSFCAKSKMSFFFAFSVTKTLLFFLHKQHLFFHMYLFCVCVCGGVSVCMCECVCAIDLGVVYHWIPKYYLKYCFVFYQLHLLWFYHCKLIYQKILLFRPAENHLLIYLSIFHVILVSFLLYFFY